MIKAEDLRIDVFSNGSQRWLRITHMPTGLVAQAQTVGRSQMQTKQAVLDELRERLEDP